MSNKLYIYQYNTLTLDCSVYGINNIANYTPYFTAKTNEYSTTYSIVNTGTILDASGTIRFSLNTYDTSVEAGNYIYDITIQNDSSIYTIVRDLLYIVEPVKDNDAVGGNTPTITYWDDLVMPLTTTKQGSNSLPHFDQNEVAYLFPNNDTTEILYFAVQMPHQRKVNSNVNPHVHYRQKTNQKPVFKLDYKWFNIGSSVPSTWKTYTMDGSVVTWVDSSTHQLAVGSSMLDGSTYGISSMMICKLYRDDAVVTGDVPAWQFDIHYEIDSFGSRQEYIK